VDQFTLELSDEFIFNVRFGDSTSNSEKNAESVSLEEIIIGSSKLFISIEMNKD
jgi:hypothetical protein